MTLSRIVISLLAAQIVASSAAVVQRSHLRTESTSQNSKTLTFSDHVWNNTMTRLFQQEIEITKADPPKVDKVLYVLFAMLFGCCGCDRCFMGQVLLGCLKGFTGGGFLIWFIIDYWVAVYSALAKHPKIDMMGYHATFKESSVENAFWVAIILLVLNIVNQYRAGVEHQRQMEQQDKLLQGLLAEQPDAFEKAFNVPVRHQSLAHIPAPLRKALRKANVVSKHATIPELIASFAAMDKDGDGQIDREELKTALSAMGVSDEDVDVMIKEADTDGDGKISKDEFLAYQAKKHAEKAAKKAAEA